MREDKQIENIEVQSFLLPPVMTPVGGDYGVENKTQVSPADQQGPRPRLKASRILHEEGHLLSVWSHNQGCFKKKKKVQLLFYKVVLQNVLHVHSDSVQL